MASIVLFSPYTDIAKDRETAYLGMGHDVYSYPAFENFIHTFHDLPHIDLIVTGMKLVDTSQGDHIVFLRGHPRFEGRFSETPILAYSVDRYDQKYVAELGATEFICFPQISGSNFVNTVDPAIGRYVPPVPGHRGNLAIYNPARPNSLIR